VPAKGMCSWHCIISKGLVYFSMCCGDTVTEFNIKKDGIPLGNVPCFHFHDKVRKHLLTCHAPTPHWGIAKPCHCNWWWRKDQGQRLSLLAGCSVANTARRKLISLLCQTSYLVSCWWKLPVDLNPPEPCTVLRCVLLSKTFTLE
jgi:hypothetical protein